MNAQEFLTETLSMMDEPSLELLKEILLGGYIEFSFHEPEDVDVSALAEKLSDYFKLACMYTAKPFGDLAALYMDGLDAIVGPRIAQEAQSGKGVPRAKRYYDRFVMYKSSRDVTIDDFLDYSRIMFCLYQAIVDNDMHAIEDFDYDAHSLDVALIVKSMLAEEMRVGFPPFTSMAKRFDTKEPHGTGSCIIVMTVIVLAAIAFVEFEKVDDHE